MLAGIELAAERLGNTRAVARSSDVDPRVRKAHRLGVLEHDDWDDDPDPRARLSPGERPVRRVLDLHLPSSGRS